MPQKPLLCRVLWSAFFWALRSINLFLIYLSCAPLIAKVHAEVTKEHTQKSKTILTAKYRAIRRYYIGYPIFR